MKNSCKIGQTFESVFRLGIFTDPRDGNTYRTVMIGAQCWLAENLRYLTSVSPIAARLPLHLWEDAKIIYQTQPYFYVYDYQGCSIEEAKSNANYQNYGALYNWPAALQACPPGWHLPTDQEWTQMVDYITLEYKLFNDWIHIEGVGNALKARHQIASPLGCDFDTTEHPRWESIHTPPPDRQTVSVNVGAHYGKDIVGFSALPGGRMAYGKFIELGFYGHWWSSSDYYETRAWCRMMRHEFGDVTRFNFDKGAGLSVRCIRD